MNRTILPALLLVLAALVFFAWLSEEVIEGHTAQFDQDVRAWVHERSAPPLTSAMRAFTLLGSPLVLWLLVVLVFFLFWKTNWRHEAWFFGIAMLGALALDVGLKLGFQRPRPAPFFGIALPHSYSYPSGHALYSLCFYGIIASLTTLHLQHAWARCLVWLAAALLAGLIGYSRIYLGVHYPSDVIAGYSVALIWVISLSAASRLRRNQKQRGAGDG